MNAEPWREYRWTLPGDAGSALLPSQEEINLRERCTDALWNEMWRTRHPGPSRQSSLNDFLIERAAHPGWP